MKKKLLFLTLVLAACSLNSEKADKLKIVSLSTTHTEIVQALGGGELLVGADSFSQTPETVKKIDAFTATTDEILELNPDVVLIAFDINEIVTDLEGMQMKYALLPPARNFEDVYSQIEIIGNLIHKENEAKNLISSMRQDVSTILQNTTFKDIKIFHEIGYTYGIYTVNQNSFIGEIYNLLGVKNIANELEDPYSSGYPEISEEKIIESNPDLIVVGHSDYLNKDLSTRTSWKNLTALKSNNIYFLDENLANNWGINTVDLLNVLNEIIDSKQDPGIIYSNKYFEQEQKTQSDQVIPLLAQVAVLLVLFVFVLVRIYTQRENEKLKIKL
ncbi:MAG: ABC transporter substrate-binding protein [Actinomycetota bacterium]|nr:ABC transporter substrate-binding protein [Actinomycetota bacterium]